jgi:hypothetical protein
VGRERTASPIRSSPRAFLVIDLEAKLLKVGSQPVSSSEVAMLPQNGAASQNIPSAAGGRPLSGCLGSGKVRCDASLARSRFGFMRPPGPVGGIGTAPMPAIPGVPFLVLIIDRYAVCFEVSAQLVGLRVVPLGAHLLPVEQHVVNLALREPRRRGARRGLLHQKTRVQVHLLV